ncbi:WhiB family transcriptional regulator [Streptomyces resistomycificus]|uniref:WhiB family transcriptional regulator n=1 Tax=Streptomyces resistomycificus TaxID=67356 RepID=UPI00055C20DF|nr:WhiB family transcriptional regulator [Streptomyces resistomycificus]KUN99532.1 hypothetical protein AQJ84_11330 [Streptomyces resistomycificus]
MTADRYAWMDAALCAQADPEAWTETGPGHGSRQPKRICGECPVRPDCTAHANRLEAVDGAMTGIWGGASQQQRRVTRRQMGEAA